MRKPQVGELARLFPETSTKLYVHEFGFWKESELQFRSGQERYARRGWVYYTISIRVHQMYFDDPSLRLLLYLIQDYYRVKPVWY